MQFELAFHGSFKENGFIISFLLKFYASLAFQIVFTFSWIMAVSFLYNLTLTLVAYFQI